MNISRDTCNRNSLCNKPSHSSMNSTTSSSTTTNTTSTTIYKTQFLKSLTHFHKQNYETALNILLSLYDTIGHQHSNSMHALASEGNLGLLTTRFIAHCYFHLELFRKARHYYERSKMVAKAMNRLEDEYRIDFHLLLLEMRQMSEELLDGEIQLGRESLQHQANNNSTILAHLKHFSSQYLEKYWWNNISDRSLLAKISLVVGISICTSMTREKSTHLNDPSFVPSHVAQSIQGPNAAPNKTAAQHHHTPTTDSNHSLIDFAQQSIQKSCKYYTQISKKRFVYKINAMYSQYHLATLLETHKRDYKGAVQLYQQVYDFFFSLLKKGKRQYSDDEVQVDEDKERDLALVDDHLWLDPAQEKDLTPIESKQKNTLKRHRKETMIDKEFNRFSIPPYEEILKRCAHHLEMCYFFLGDCGSALRICDSFKSYKMQLYLSRSVENYVEKSISVVDMKQQAVRLYSTFLIYHVVCSGRLLLIWILTPGESDCQCVPMPVESIESMLPNPEKDPHFVRRVKLQELYNLLILPVQHLMPVDSPEQHVVIFPDEQLVNVPYQSLIDSETNMHLIENHSICLCESFLFLEFSLALKGYSLSKNQRKMKGLFVKARGRDRSDDNIPVLTRIFETSTLLKGMSPSEILHAGDSKFGKNFGNLLSTYVPFLLYLTDVSLLMEGDNTTGSVDPSLNTVALGEYSSAKHSKSKVDSGVVKKSKSANTSAVKQSKSGGSDKTPVASNNHTITIGEHDFSGTKCLVVNNSNRSKAMSMTDVFRLYHTCFVAGIPSMLMVTSVSCSNMESAPAGHGSLKKRDVHKDIALSQQTIINQCLDFALNYNTSERGRNANRSSPMRKQSDVPNLSKLVFEKGRSPRATALKNQERSFSLSDLGNPTRKNISFSHCLQKAVLEYLKQHRKDLNVDLVLSSLQLIGDPYGPFSQNLGVSASGHSAAISYESMNGIIDSMEPESIEFLKMRRRRDKEGK